MEQPESEFLLRLDDDGNVGLFEADGGMWKKAGALNSTSRRNWARRKKRRKGGGEDVNTGAGSLAPAEGKRVMRGAEEARAMEFWVGHDG